MHLKFKNTSVDIPNWIMFMGLLVADSMYANHCKKKTVEKLLVDEVEPKKGKEA